MNRNDAFPGKYLKAAELPEEGQKFRISKVTEEDLGTAGRKDRKPVVWFENEPKGFVLNVTNFKTIEKVTEEEDTDNWAGHEITLYPTEVEFQGDTVLSIRVRLKVGKAAKATKAKAEPTEEKAAAATAGGELAEDDIPF